MAQRRPPKRRANDGAPPEGLDLDGLNAIAEYGGLVISEGRRLPLVRPRDPGADLTEFDQAVCAAGLKAFFRPLTPGEIPAELLVAGEEYLLLEEMARGVRLKRPVAIIWTGDVSRN
jgi:hypothetical protein